MKSGRSVWASPMVSPKARHCESPNRSDAAQKRRWLKLAIVSTGVVGGKTTPSPAIEV